MVIPMEAEIVGLGVGGSGEATGCSVHKSFDARPRKQTGQLKVL